MLRETLAAQQDTGVGVFDLEIIRIGPDFDPHTWDALYDAGAALGAKAILVAGDDPNVDRLSAHYAQLCEVMLPYGMSADLEFMPWTAVPHARAARHVIEQAGCPKNAGVLIDALHVGRSDTTMDDLRALCNAHPEWLHYAQWCDATAGTHFSTEAMIHTARCERLLPGEGTIGLHDLAAVLPVGLPISVEVVNFAQEAQYPPDAWASRCLAATRPYFASRTE